jgi:hypothetical protein
MAGVKKANRKMLKADIKDVDWARLAAYIDGEGCINIHTNRGQVALGKSQMHSLVLGITNTDPRLPAWIFETFGVGNCYRIPDSPSIAAKIALGKWQPRFHWNVTSISAAQLLEGCLPFFVIKREQAEIAIAFQKTKIHHNRGKRGERTPRNVIQMREQMAHQVRQLKHVNLPIQEVVNG